MSETLSSYFNNQLLHKSCIKSYTVVNLINYGVCQLTFSIWLNTLITSWTSNQKLKLNCRIWLTHCTGVYTGTDPNSSALAQPRICFLRKWIVMKKKTKLNYLKIVKMRLVVSIWFAKVESTFDLFKAHMKLLANNINTKCVPCASQESLRSLKLRIEHKRGDIRIWN